MDLLFTLFVVGIISSQIVDVLIGQSNHNTIHVGINPFHIPEITQFRSEIDFLLTDDFG